MAAYLLDSIPIRQLDSNGDPVPGALLYTYAANTSTPKPTYTDASGATPLPNPIVSDGAGYWPAVWLDGGAYALRAKKPDATALWERLDVTAAAGMADAALQDFKDDLSAAGGSSLVGWLADGAGAIGRTVQQALREQGSIWITSFAPPGSAVDGTYDWTAAWALATAFAFGGARRPAIRFPAGIFPIDRIELDSVRGLHIIGEAATDPVAANGRTWIYWKTGSTASSLIKLKSCSYNVFRDINFFSNGAAGKTSLLEFQCNSSITVLPLNKFASSYNLFDGVAFVVSPSAPMSVATVNCKSALSNIFRRCPLYGTNAIKLGADTDVDPISGDPTIPDGRAVSTVIEDCPIFGNIILERVLGASFTRPYFGANSVPFTGTSYRIAYWQVTGNMEVRNLRVNDLICDSANTTHNVPVWFPAIAAPAVEPSGQFENCQLNGAGTMLDFASGNWIAKGCKFIAEQKPGVTSWIGIRLADGLKKFEASMNDYDGLMALNTASVVASAVVDTRTSFEDRNLLLARGRAADLVLASNNFTQVLSRTIDHLEGGLVELSYDITITSLVDSAYIARLVVDGTPLVGSYAQATSNLAGTKTFPLSMGPRVLKLPPTDLTTNRVIELQVQQVSGASFATIRGDSFTNATTFALLKVVA